MIILKEGEYELRKGEENLFYVNFLRGQALQCPLCFGAVKCKDTRKRILRISNGQTIWLQITRVKCRQCGRLHSLLPDCVVPYKQYSKMTIQQALQYKSCSKTLNIAAEESTINRWRRAYLKYTPTLRFPVQK